MPTMDLACPMDSLKEAQDTGSLKPPTSFFYFPTSAFLLLPTLSSHSKEIYLKIMSKEEYVQ